MTDVVVSESATSLTPLVPHDGPEETNSATIVSSTRHSKNMKNRVRKVRGSSQKGGRGVIGGSATIAEDKPQYKDYLAEQRARRLQRFKSKGKYEGQKDDLANDIAGGDDDASDLKSQLNASGDSGRGISAGSSGSKDEGIHSNGEKDEELEQEQTGDKNANERLAEEVEDDDEGRGSINDEDEEVPSSPTGADEADDEESLHSGPEGERDGVPEFKPAGGEHDYYVNGYHGDMDEPNSLGASYQDSLGVSSDAGLGTTAELSLLRSGLEEMLQRDKEEGREEEEEERREVEEEYIYKEHRPLLQIEEEGSSANEAKESDNEQHHGEEEPGGKEEEKEEEESDAKVDAVDEDGGPGEDKESEEDKKEEEEENEASERDAGETSDEKAEHATGSATDKESDAAETKYESEKETQESDTAETKYESEKEAQESDAAENKDESEKETQESDAAETKYESEKEAQESDKDTAEEKEKENDSIDDGAKDSDLSQETDEAKAGNEEEEEKTDKDSEGGGQKEQEEEIQEVPAIAKIPGRYRRRNVAARVDNSQKKSPRKKPVNMSKVASNRKPISYRSGPIQTSSRPEMNRFVNGRVPRRNFKARSMAKKGVEMKHAETKGEDAKGSDEGEPDEGDSQASQEDRKSSIAESEPQDMPPVNIGNAGDNDILGALETNRSIGQTSQTESQTDSQADSQKEPLFQDISRPRTAGKSYRESRVPAMGRRVGGKGSTSLKTSGSQPRKGSSTSEVWVPEEDKLYVYTYSSQPRLLQVRRMGARVATTDKWDNDPNSSFRLKMRGNGNPMYDRRVVRGSNYAKRIDGDDLPKWNPYFSNARSLTQHEAGSTTDLSQSQQLRRQEFRQKLEARARLRRENHGVSSLYPSHSGASHNFHRSYARAHAHVQTENYYEPLERPPESEAGVQTDPWSEDGFIAPVVAPAAVPGVDATTQVYDAEIDADSDDDALIALLVGRTMREAVYEVAREEQAEENRINSLTSASLSSFLKHEEPSRDQDEGEEKGNSNGDSTSEKREEPEGKETTPEGEVPLSNGRSSPAHEKEELKIPAGVEEGQEQESLVN